MLVESKANVDPFAKRRAQCARVENQLAWLKRLMRVIIGVIVAKQRWLEAVVEDKRREAATKARDGKRKPNTFPYRLLPIVPSDLSDPMSPILFAREF